MPVSQGEKTDKYREKGEKHRGKTCNVRSKTTTAGMDTSSKRSILSLPQLPLHPE